MMKGPTETDKTTGRRCVFCGKPAGSREHALPDWLARTMGLENEPAQPGLLSSARGIEMQGNPRATGKLITKGVCGACNGGWMAELEGQIRPILGPLVCPGFSNLTRDALDPLDQHLPLLQRWLLKTAVTLGMVAPSGDVGSLPEEAAVWAFENAIPSSCMVYAGWIEVPTFAKTLGRGLRMLNGGAFRENLIHDHSLNLRLQLNHLGLRLVNAPDAVWVLTTCFDSAGRQSSPRALGTTGRFPDDEHDSILFRNFFEFANVCVLATGSVPEGIAPEENRKMSESIRRLIP